MSEQNAFNLTAEQLFKLADDWVSAAAKGGLRVSYSEAVADLLEAIKLLGDSQAAPVEGLPR